MTDVDAEAWAKAQAAESARRTSTPFSWWWRPAPPAAQAGDHVEACAPHASSEVNLRSVLAATLHGKDCGCGELREHDGDQYSAMAEAVVDSEVLRAIRRDAWSEGKRSRSWRNPYSDIK